MAILEWNAAALATRRANLKKVQSFVDSEVLRYCDPMTPKVTGNLINSGKLGTKVGSGTVSYTAPYAHTQYYDTKDTRTYDPRRGGHWFDRMKVDHKKDIEKGAQKII